MTLRAGTPQEAGISPERLQRVSDLCREWVASSVTQAIAAAVVRHGVLVFTEALGRVAPEPDAAPLRHHALFPVASISKPITATLAMLLVEDGRLGLNRPVAEYIPEFGVGEGKQDVMVHHLLTHTSGLDGAQMIARAAAKLGVEAAAAVATVYDLEVDEFLLLNYDAPLAAPPSAAMVYANENYELLGEIIRRVSGVTLNDFARKRLLGPLGMRDSYFNVPDSEAGRVVVYPQTSLGALLNSPDTLRREWASVGVYCTAQDLAIFLQLFLNGGDFEGQDLLSPATVREMTRNQIPGVSAHYNNEVFAEASWGYGWDVHDYRKKSLRDGSLKSPRSYNHGGGAGSYIWVDPAYDLVGAYCSVKTYPEGRVESPLWRGDYFVNAVTAAVRDDR